MNLHFFGGANEIGASSTSIEIEESRILVDAGIRMGPGQDSRLPDFWFDKTGMPDVVLLTHAHTDHTGALPILHKMLPENVKIYCTPPTKEITRILLEDNARRMERAEQEDESFKYTLDDVAAVLKRMELVPWLEPIQISEGVTARWIRAGHILGAAMIYIEGRNESILMTGDVSVGKQLTIPSVDVPSWCKPDVMVTEATYGDRLHEVARNKVERDLVEDVAKTIAAGGKVLIPVFAVGRSQEVILILKRAMERGEIPEFPVYVDGMVRDVNAIYPRFADELQRPLRRKAEQGESLFYSDAIKEVPRGPKPESILAEGPCCIVASSGMLKGGKSPIYAQYLVGIPKNLIAITGYQAEGTPGHALWDWVKAGRPPDQVWQLNDQESVGVKCRVEKYSLSAHADSEQLMGLVNKVRPRKLFLVHGDDKARKKLAESVHKDHPAIEVVLPKNGKTYTVKKQVGLAAGRQFANDRILFELSTFLQKMGWKERFFSIRDLAEMWFGTEAITTVMIKFFEWCLSLDGRFFERDRLNNLFRLKQPIYSKVKN